MKDYILSIYIPTFNRAQYLTGLLENIYNEISYENKDAVEVVVSDNASLDNTECMAKALCQQYTESGWHFRYHKNAENIGSCRNFLQCTDYINGKWCWLVGDDDMILHDGIKNMLQELYENEKRANPVDYYCLNYAYITMEERKKYLETPSSQADIRKEQYFFENTGITMLDGYSELFMMPSQIPAHTGTFLGGNLFRREMWTQMRPIVDYEKAALKGMNEHEQYRLCADYVFPHLKIAAKACMHRKIGYIGVPCIGLGVGEQENAAQNWRFIDSVVFNDLFEWYQECGMTKAAQKAFVDSFGPRCGKNLAGLFAGQGITPISQETVVSYLMKYGSNKEFAESFIDGIAYFMESPIKARYNAFSNTLLKTMLQPYIEQKQRVAIWGTGEMAQSVLTCCEGLCGQVVLLIDGSKFRWGKTMSEVPQLVIQPPEALKTVPVDMIFISSVEYADEIIEQIKQLDITVDIVSCKGKMEYSKC